LCNAMAWKFFQELEHTQLVRIVANTMLYPMV
jgi:hypothetical protein